MKRQTTTVHLDRIFEALSSKHRREIIHMLSLQPMALNKLAAERKLSLPAIYKHIKILEKADMVIRKKTGQTNYLSLRKASLRALQEWVMQYHPYWGSDTETQENYVPYLKKP